MRLGRRERKEQEAQIDLTPMLDIVFIMLIFFIVTTTFVQESAIEVSKPKASNASPLNVEPLVISVDRHNQLYFNEKWTDIDSLSRLLASKDASRALLISADKQAYNGTIVSIMDKAKAAGITQISLATETSP